MKNYQGLIDKYRGSLPIAEDAKILSLQEGNTPLLALNNIVAQNQLELSLYAKYEGLNPTGSFKDRGMVVAVTQALYEGKKAIICASTGNTSASAAAYAARAGLKAFVIIPEGNIAMGKLAQAMMHGAVVLQISGNFDDGMALVKQLADEEDIAIVNSINPYRLQGQKTASFEVVEQLGCVPDYHCFPVGNAGNITAYWMGYEELLESNKIPKCPVMLGYQAEGAAPIVLGKKVEKPETVATAIRIGNPQSWQKALNAQQESNGWFATCTDEEILTTQKMLAQTEGLFCEPASAISLAGLLKDYRAGKIAKGSQVVCTLTGHGLKDPDIAIAQCKQKLLKLEPEIVKIRKVLSGYV